jgi:hypothetical protein
MEDARNQGLNIFCVEFYNMTDDYDPINPNCTYMEQPQQI